MRCCGLNIRTRAAEEFSENHHEASSCVSVKIKKKKKNRVTISRGRRKMRKLININGSRQILSLDYDDCTYCITARLTAPDIIYHVYSKNVLL